MTEPATVAETADAAASTSVDFTARSADECPPHHRPDHEATKTCGRGDIEVIADARRHRQVHRHAESSTEQHAQDCTQPVGRAARSHGRPAGFTYSFSATVRTAQAESVSSGSPLKAIASLLTSTFDGWDSGRADRNRTHHPVTQVTFRHAPDPSPVKITQT
ncbi:hypothetical protein [Nocardia tenerifensis]|uniref:hypothetical protein n=1 Tax=Nocardia tenerifensis TaxID=228006 RepID=UPI0011B357DD|nr:hypothetical protein [Nocardia tenerifensis]